MPFLVHLQMEPLTHNEQHPYWEVFQRTIAYYYYSPPHFLPNLFVVLKTKMWLSRIVDVDLYLLEKMHKGLVMLCKCTFGSNKITIRLTPGLFPCSKKPWKPWNVSIFLAFVIPGILHSYLIYICNSQNHLTPFYPCATAHVNFPRIHQEKSYLPILET